VLLGGAALGLICAATAAQAADAPGEHGFTANLDLKLDVMGPVAGGAAQAGRQLSDLTLAVDLDLERALGWSGVSAHVDISNTSGGAPSELAGALQGVEGIEVSAHRLRLYQAWIETSFAQERGNLRAGFSDLSGEFATVDSSGLLINPSFGMAAEFAASGAAAYPSTALGLRLRLAPTKTTYVQAAVANAQAGVPGDRGGADFGFNAGTVLITEAGWTGAGKLAVGYWRLSERQDDLSELDAAGDPRRRIAQGGYMLAERVLGRSADGIRTATGFIRAGVADGRTTAFRGSVQAGLLVSPAFASRPESSIAFGVTQARLAPAWREVAAAAGGAVGRSETVFELTYSDQLTPRIRLQPDLQYVRRPSGGARVKDALVAALRLNIGF
jgi:porin